MKKWIFLATMLFMVSMPTFGGSPSGLVQAQYTVNDYVITKVGEISTRKSFYLVAPNLIEDNQYFLTVPKPKETSLQHRSKESKSSLLYAHSETDNLHNTFIHASGMGGDGLKHEKLVSEKSIKVSRALTATR